MINLLNKLYGYRNYSNEAVKYVAKEAETLLIALKEHDITPREYEELIQDLEETVKISDLAASAQAERIVYTIFQDLKSVTSAFK